MNFVEWLESKDACPDSIKWVKDQPDQSLEALWSTCHRGDWMLWVHARVGTSEEDLASVSYRVANRSVQYAITALEVIGVSHPLREAPKIFGSQTAKQVARAVAEVKAGPVSAILEAVARAVQSAAFSEEILWWAGEAAAVAAYAVVNKHEELKSVSIAAAAWEASVARAAELKLSADDCRELLSLPNINFD